MGDLKPINESHFHSAYLMVIGLEEYTVRCSGAHNCPVFWCVILVWSVGLNNPGESCYKNNDAFGLELAFYTDLDNKCP